MSHDTQAENKQRLDLDAMDEIWLFGYGSLIYKVDFPILDSCDAYILGWERRFWQGSHDHRGTMENPGRVLTLINVPGGRCDGVAYKVTHEVFDHLDHREKNGYLRHQENFYLPDGTVKNGIAYIADEHNEAYLGPLAEKDIARHIALSKGPSGTNSDYVYHLAEALRAKNFQDDHVFNIEDELRRLEQL